MSRIEAVAMAYGLTRDDVATWPGQVVDVLHRHAVNVGWLLPEPTQETT